MTDEITREEKALAALGRRVREGASKQFPITEKQRAAMRGAVSQQWDKEQEIAKAIAASKNPSEKADEPGKSQSKEQDRTKSGDSAQAEGQKSKSKGHSH